MTYFNDCLKELNQMFCLSTKAQIEIQKKIIQELDVILNQTKTKEGTQR